MYDSTLKLLLEPMRLVMTNELVKPSLGIAFIITPSACTEIEAGPIIRHSSATLILFIHDK